MISIFAKPGTGYNRSFGAHYKYKYFINKQTLSTNKQTHYQQINCFLLNQQPPSQPPTFAAASPSPPTPTTSRYHSIAPTTAQCHLTSPLGQKAHGNVGPTPPLMNGERGPTPAHMNGDDECPPQHAQMVMTSAHLSTHTRYPRLRTNVGPGRRTNAGPG